MAPEVLEQLPDVVSNLVSERERWLSGGLGESEQEARAEGGQACGYDLSGDYQQAHDNVEAIARFPSGSPRTEW